MAAQLALAAAKVEGADGIVASDAQVIVRENTLHVRRGGSEQTFPDVTAVRQTSRGIWTIDFGGGATLTVTRLAGRCCGR